VCGDGKADVIADFISDEDVDIAFLTETWLKPLGHEPVEKSLTPSGYRLASFPRPSLGGGVAILYKDQLHPLLSFSQSLPFSHPSFEHVQVSYQSTPHPITFSCVYRPPPSPANKLTTSMFLSDFDHLLDHFCLSPGHLLILGDINVHHDNPHSYDTKHICNSLSHHNMTQLISEPTQQSGHTLDWIISRDHANPATGNSLVLSTSLTSGLPSDHSAILCFLDISPPTRTRHTVTRRNLKSINLSTFLSEASNLLSETTHNLAEHFDTTLRHLLDTHAPATTRLLPNRPPAPWLTPEITHAKRARRRAERRGRKSKLTIHKQIFHTARTRVSTLIASAKTAYFQNKIATSSSSKELFTTMNHLLGTQTSPPLPTSHSHEELPTVFSNYFTTKIQTLREQLDATPCQPCPPDPSFSSTPLSTFTPVSQEELLNTIRSMSLKTCELDPLPSSLYPDCFPTLLPFITDIINTSLENGTVPDSFKSAIVRPLLKKHNLDPNELKNYRPISNLSFLSKLLEKVVLNQLNSHLSANNLLNPFQSAYRQSHSTETALLHILNDLLLATDSGKVSLLTFLDLSAAFDTIDHTILLTRLQHTFGISGTALSWFTSYLSDRKQTVLIKGTYSQPAHLTCGVPQGSVLGPVLFTLYTSPLSTIIKSHSLKHHFYADDTQLQDSDSPDNIQNLLTRTSDCYSDVKNWMTNNKLKLNDDKTESILISTRQKLSQLPPLSLQLCNTAVPITDSAKNLGVHIDSTLSMQNFVSQTAKTCYYHLRRISLIRKHLSTEATAKLILCFIMSRIDYCNSLLFGVNESSTNTLQRIQNNAARLVLRKKKTDHISPLLTQLHWLPVSKRIQYKLDTICYKCLNNAAPVYLTNRLNIYTPSRTLRSASDPLILRTPRTKLKSFGPRAFSVSGPLSWNKLPLSVRQQSTFSTFKTSLKTHLFSSP
jgi:exonuclease III